MQTVTNVPWPHETEKVQFSGVPKKFQLAVFGRQVVPNSRTSSKWSITERIAAAWCEADTSQPSLWQPSLSREACPVVPLLISSPSIPCRLEYKICLLIFKCLHQMAPVYLTVMSDPVSTSASRSHLRSAARGDLAVPWSRTTTYGQRSFLSLIRHCGTRCHSLFMTHLWQWRSSAHIWRLFCFAEHIVLSTAPSWQFRL